MHSADFFRQNNTSFYYPESDMEHWLPESVSDFQFNYALTYIPNALMEKNDSVAPMKAAGIV